MAERTVPMELSKVAIRTDGTITTVTVDGVDVSKRATRVCFEHTAGTIPIVTITLAVDDLTVEGSVGTAIRNGCASDNDTTEAKILLPLKRFRVKAGLSQENVATCVGVGRSAVAMWETGKTKPRTEMLPKLAALFGCTVDEMLTDQSTQDVDQSGA